MKRYMYAQTEPTVSEREERNRRLAYEAALEGMVLLKNDAVLPQGIGTVALFGAGAKHTVKGGSGSGEVNERHAVSIYEGLTGAGYTLTAGSERWLADYEADCAAAEEEARRSHHSLNELLDLTVALPFGRLITAEETTEAADLAIFVAARMAGEGADKKLDRDDFSLSAGEVENVRRLAAAYKKLLLVINSGSPMDLCGTEETAGAVLFFAEEGMEGGTAFADIVMGRRYPSGKLVDTWAKGYGDIPCGDSFSYLSGNTEREEYREGIFVGYRYFDSFGVKPLYPFGFGLGYTDFRFACKKITVEADAVSVEAAVRNVGTRRGREILQLYVSAPAGRLPKEKQRLAAFAKTAETEPGDTAILNLQFRMKDCASYDEASSSWVLEEGDYVLYLGNSSRNTVPAAVLTLERECAAAVLKPVCRAEPVEEIAPPAYSRDDVPADIPRFAVRPEDIPCDMPDYQPKEEAFSAKTREILAQLSEKEKVEVCVGEGTAGMFSTAGIYAPGAVGRTTAGLIKKGLVNVNLSDGPAGLRLLQKSAIDVFGKLRMVEGHLMTENLRYMPKALLSLVTKSGDRGRFYYQFCTAFPVELAQAQSWNTELLTRIGQAIREEMDEYGITYYLAPGMNIHRNPLGGRNFEYYSEDPLLTGKMAAALTRGVQEKPGRYVTVKHFCCNNQEDNRKHSDSRLNERALREIYLKGFEIAVREGGAKSLMTSYNLVNGIYPANRSELCTDVLRGEWGFEGVVMTDWTSTGEDLGDAGKALASGNDLIMPGSSWDKKNILQGLKDGTLSPAELDRAAGRIVESIVQSAVYAKWQAEQPAESED